MKPSTLPRTWLPPNSAFAGFRFPAEVIVVAVWWYPRSNLSYRDVEELLVERDIEVGYVYRAIDQYGQVIDVLVSTSRDATVAIRGRI